MNAIKYLFEDIYFSPQNLPPKYKILDFIKNKTNKNPSICFIFCSDNYLQKLNVEFLNHEELTDVISFDYSEKNKIKGDVFISVERVKENAKIYNIKFKEELSRVMIHGVLHLAGYKDKNPEEKKMMRKLENQFLKLVI